MIWHSGKELSKLSNDIEGCVIGKGREDKQKEQS